jgi:hypothetical protein
VNHAAAKANKQTATKFVNDLMHGTFSLQYMATHTVAGGNANKTSIDEAIAGEIISKCTCNLLDVLSLLYLRLKLAILPHQFAMDMVCFNIHYL